MSFVFCNRLWLKVTCMVMSLTMVTVSSVNDILLTCMIVSIIVGRWTLQY